MTIMTGREVKSLKSPFCEDALRDAICPRALSISGSLETRLSNMHKQQPALSLSHEGMRKNDWFPFLFRIHSSYFILFPRVVV
jgi:hypothetical protein